MVLSALVVTIWLAVLLKATCIVRFAGVAPWGRKVVRGVRLGWRRVIVEEVLGWRFEREWRAMYTLWVGSCMSTIILGEWGGKGTVVRRVRRE